MIKKAISVFTVFFFISSCQDVEMYEKDKFGSLTLSFIKSSEELISSLENNRSSSQFADVDQVRITLSGEAPTIVDYEDIVNGNASYSRSGLPVGTISIKVDLVGAGVNKYTQNKSVTIIANQNATASFNAFTVTNQSISFISSLDSTYDIGDEISLAWSNSHADQPVDIERWDFIGSTWVKTETLASDWVGNSGLWTTQGESSGENVKVRIRSTISNVFADSDTFQLLGQEDNGFFFTYKYNGQNTMFHDVIRLDDGNAVAVGRYGTPSDRHALMVKFDTNEGTILATHVLEDQSSFRHITKGYNNELLVTGYLIGNYTQVVLGAFNQDLSTIAVNVTDSANSKEADSVDLYTNNGVDYILVSGSYNESGYPQPAVHMFDSSYNFITTWFYDDEGKFQNVKVINDSYIWLQGNNGAEPLEFGGFIDQTDTTLAIWSNLNDQTLTEERTLSNWVLQSNDLEGTKPSFSSTENIYTTKENLVYVGGFETAYYGGGIQREYSLGYAELDFVENPNGDFAWVGSSRLLPSAQGGGACDPNNDGQPDICATIKIAKGGSVSWGSRPTQSFPGSNPHPGYASHVAFKAIDLLDDGYVMVGDEILRTSSINLDHEAIIAVVDFDGELKTIDKSSIKRNTAINYTSSANFVDALHPNRKISIK